MKKVYHRNRIAEAVPKEVYDPFYVTETHCALSEVEEMVELHLEQLKPFKGHYQLVLEFTEPNTDKRFVLGHIGAVISIYAEYADDVKNMQKVLGF